MNVLSLFDGKHVLVSKQKKIVEDGGDKALTLLARNYKGFGNQKMSGSQNEHGIRMLYPIEYERLQTVPDDYTSIVSKTQRYKMLGNGWTVDVISHILRGIV